MHQAANPPAHPARVPKATAQHPAGPFVKDILADTVQAIDVVEKSGLSEETIGC
jgi:hypothetical protein